MTINPSTAFFCIGLFFLQTISFRAFATSPEDMLKSYMTEAKKIDPGFKDFNAADGKAFYFARQTLKSGKKSSCAECHTKDPKSHGKAPTGKLIEPMAPAINPKRFTDSSKVEKWFKRNCKDVYERACTAIEKGNFIKFMMSIN